MRCPIDGRSRDACACGRRAYAIRPYKIRELVFRNAPFNCWLLMPEMPQARKYHRHAGGVCGRDAFVVAD
jgi:hypothetical protein